ncbi:MAG: methyltransferase domain-containing protein [Phycisphaeraceae bacterium]|nr:methyltransferase domain-containing protein [Phycisphaeraceae bacterium]
MFTPQQILEHYKSEAAKHGESGTSTIQDLRTRQLEIEALFAYVRDGMRVLEIGCGNGYVAQAMVERFAVDLAATDFSPEMIGIARARRLAQARGKVSFAVGDVLKLAERGQYDLVFTERCLQNLPTWEDQQKALMNIAGALKSGGQFVMLESFTTGSNNLNAGRAELGLPLIPPPWHNLFFDEAETKAFLAAQGCRYVDQNCFLSGYYFGSRLLMPKLLADPAKAKSSSVLNDFFCALPAAGDFCPMKILRFKRE